MEVMLNFLNNSRQGGDLAIFRGRLPSQEEQNSHHIFTTKLSRERQNALVLIASDFCWEMLLSQNLLY